MTFFTILLLVVILAAVTYGVFKWKTSKANGGPTVRLWCFNGYPLSSQTLPENTYVPTLGRAPRTLKECELAGWYPSKEAAIKAGAPVPVPPPFGGEAPVQGKPELFFTTGLVNENGEIVLGSWTGIRRV